MQPIVVPAGGKDKGKGRAARAGGAAKNMTTSTKGMISMMRCCAGSMVVGVIFCIASIVMPIRMGVAYRGSFWLRSGIHRNAAPRRSMETISTR